MVLNPPFLVANSPWKSAKLGPWPLFLTTGFPTGVSSRHRSNRRWRCSVWPSAGCYQLVGWILSSLLLKSIKYPKNHRLGDFIHIWDTKKGVFNIRQTWIWGLTNQEFLWILSVRISHHLPGWWFYIFWFSTIEKGCWFSLKGLSLSHCHQLNVIREWSNPFFSII